MQRARALVFAAVLSVAGVALMFWQKGQADACTDWWGCAELGLCHSDQTTCMAKSDSDCAGRWICETLGHCSAAHGVCQKAGSEAPEDHQGDCATGEHCRFNGHCHRKGRWCLAEPDDCARSKGCAEESRCTFEFGYCVASAADCAASTVCKEKGEGCRSVRGTCDRPKQPFIYFQF